MAAETAVRVRIEGRVQGIGFRYWTIDQAAALGLRGWVRNRIDGAVEAVFAGPGEAVAEMVRRCHDGPAFAHVERVERVAEDPEAEPVGPGFHVAPTA
ncbi:MAG: acylphosphatase [Proteobacteria bacterium]|nr:acylphosphatase [Pseudomonadota bacterium]